jgi:hypothetical protein
MSNWLISNSKITTHKNIVENHLAQFNMKIYVHEDSPCDKTFRGFRAYEEAHNRFQTLPPNQ